MEKIWLKSYAPGIPAEIVVEEITLQDAFSKTVSRFPENPALIFQGKVISYRRLDEMVARCAGALLALGVTPGDKVALILPNLIQTVVASFATFRLGAVVVPNNPLYTDRELEHQLSDSGAQVVFCFDVLVPRLIKLRDRTAVKKIISCHIRDYLPFPLNLLFPLVKRGMHLKTPKENDVYDFMDLMKSSTPWTKKHPSAMEDTAVLIYTGGTTGVSKGVNLTHTNLSANCQQMRAWCPDFFDGKEVILGCLPFFHLYGLTVVMNLAVFYGWCNVLIPKPEAKAILDAVDKYSVTLIPGVPTLFNAMINYPDIKKYSLKSIKGCFSAAAPLAVETIRGFRNLTGILISEAYGMTETGPCTHAIPLGGKEKPGCIGLPLPSTDAKLVDMDDYSKEITTFNEPGELCVKGPQVMKGYLNNPEETKTVLKDGWLLTGDIAVMDEEGYFTIVDRKKDMIISGGFNIYPREIDEVLYTHSKILEACAVGVFDSHSGERVKAFVVLKPGETATEKEIIDFCREKMTRYKIPKEIEFVSDLPKSAVGKILRKELRRQDSGHEPSQSKQ
jgi:long-chain acyl-CoA synthetase